jgi:hypothetical protein
MHTLILALLALTLTGTAGHGLVVALSATRTARR